MMSANLDKKTRRSVYRRDGWRCALCDATTGLQIHHIIPRSKGGTDLRGNLITLCWKCHAVAHGTRMPEYPEHIDRDWIEQACIEYISDYYAEVLDQAWNPWDSD